MEMHGTTIVAVRNEKGVVIAGDGQVTMGERMVMKHSARKVRRLYKGQVIAGFAGATADAFTLFERFEAKLEENGGNLVRAAVELAKDWRKDKYLRQLQALLLVADAGHTLVLTGTGDVIEPDDGVAAIGSGGPYALAAAPRPPGWNGAGGHRPGSHVHCCGNLCVHQRSCHAGKTGFSLKCSRSRAV